MRRFLAKLHDYHSHPDHLHWPGSQKFRLQTTGLTGFLFILKPKLVPGAQVTGVWANTAHLDLFMTGSDGVCAAHGGKPHPVGSRGSLSIRRSNCPRRSRDCGVVQCDSPGLIHDWKRWKPFWSNLVGGCSRLAYLVQHPSRSKSQTRALP